MAWSRYPECWTWYERQEISVLPPTAYWLNKLPLKLSSTTIIMADRYGMVNPAIFEDLQARVDEDSSVRDVRNRPVVFEVAESKSTAGTSWDYPNVREARSTSLSVLSNAYSRKQADQYSSFCPEPTQLQPQQVGSIFPLASYPPCHLTSSSPRRPQRRQKFHQKWGWHHLQTLRSCFEAPIL